MAKRTNLLFMVPCVIGLLFLSACTDDKFDLGDVDTTFAIGDDAGLRLPVSSTKEIQLDDLLKLNDSKSVVILDNGDYVFQKVGDDVNPIQTSIDKISVSQESTTVIPVKINVPNVPAGYDLIPVGTALPGTAGSIRHEIQTFNYKGGHPAEVKSLKSTDIEGSIQVDISYTDDLYGFIPLFKTFNVEFPQYMDIEIASSSHAYTKKDNVLEFKDVPTNKTLTIVGNIKKLDFEKSDGVNQLTIDEKDITMIGDVKVNVTYDDAVKGSGDLNNLVINSTMAISNLTVVSATGSFCPEIKMSDIGNMEITDLPDFLTDEEVVMDLHNPQIYIYVESDLAVPGLMKGKLIGKDKSGNVISQVELPEVKINSVDDNGGVSKILICRQQPSAAEAAAYTDVKVVPTLSDLVRKIPSTISFETEARADDSRNDSRIELGHNYTIKPSYRFEAPIAFAQDAHVVYHKTMDGWNDDLEDLELANGTYIRMMTDIENKIPAYLQVTAQAIDVNGNAINDITVDVDRTIAPSPDGVTAVSTPLVVTIRQNSSNALKRLDGLIFTINVLAADGGNSIIVGKTLNAYSHNLIAKNIVVEVVGKVIIKK